MKNNIKEGERDRERKKATIHLLLPLPLHASHSLLTHRLAQVHSATSGEPPHLAEVVIGPQVGERGPPLAVAGQVLGLGLRRQGPHLPSAAPVQGVLLWVGHSERGGTELRQRLAGLPGSPLQRPHGAPLPVLEQYPNAPLEEEEEGKKSEYMMQNQRSRGLPREGKRGGGERDGARRGSTQAATTTRQKNHKKLPLKQSFCFPLTASRVKNLSIKTISMQMFFSPQKPLILPTQPGSSNPVKSQFSSKVFPSGFSERKIPQQTLDGVI